MIVGFNLYFVRRYDEAIRQLRATVAIDPDYFWAREMLGRAYTQTGRLPEALEELKAADRLSESALAEVDAAIGRLHVARGDQAEAKIVLDRLLRQAGEKFVPSYHIAAMYAGLGEKDRAFELLTKAEAERSYWNGWMHLDPDLEVLHSDPRWPSLVKKFSGRP